MADKVAPEKSVWRTPLDIVTIPLPQPLEAIMEHPKRPRGQARQDMEEHCEKVLRRIEDHYWKKQNSDDEAQIPAPKVWRWLDEGALTDAPRHSPDGTPLSIAMMNARVSAIRIIWTLDANANQRSDTLGKHLEERLEDACLSILQGDVTTAVVQKILDQTDMALANPYRKLSGNNQPTASHNDVPPCPRGVSIGDDLREKAWRALPAESWFSSSILHLPSELSLMSERLARDLCRGWAAENHLESNNKKTSARRYRKTADPPR